MAEVITNMYDRTPADIMAEAITNMYDRTPADIMAEARSISDVEARQQRQKKQGHTSTIGDAANAFSAAATAHTEPEEISTVPQPVGLNDHNFV